MRVSIALCTHNGARYLAQQLASISTQHRTPDELVIRDDRSTDNTVDIVREFSRTAPFPVSFTINETKLGVTNNFERTIAACSGDIIFLSDQDDYWLPAKINALAREFEIDDKVGLVFSDAVVTDAQLNSLGYTMWQIVKFDQKAMRRMHEGGALDHLIRRYTVTGATAAFRASLREKLGTIPDVYPHDAWIALIAAACSKVVAISPPLTMYRQHGANVTGAGSRNLLARLSESRATPAREFDLEILRNHLLLSALKSLRSDRVGSRHLKSICEKIDHLDARREIYDRALLGRLVIVVQELASLRYFKFSSGLLSVAADLFLRA
jgi:glycosyltransferase involved in cell wall biosynthesis